MRKAAANAKGPQDEPALEKPRKSGRREIRASATGPYPCGGVWELAVGPISGSQMGRPLPDFGLESRHQENGRGQLPIVDEAQSGPSTIESSYFARREAYPLSRGPWSMAVPVAAGYPQQVPCSGVGAARLASVRQAGPKSSGLSRIGEKA
jgi:hypothetical protein